MPQISYFSDNMNTFWNYVQLLIQAVEPYIMISVAVFAVGLLIKIIVKAWFSASDDKDNDNDDDDYEIRHY